jgi:3-oxoacyl-[acyl-carrier-protein] synthase I
VPKVSLAIKNTGVVCSVGLSAPAACAAIRTKIANPSETRFMDSAGDWIMAHQVTLEQAFHGTNKLAYMAAMAIDECLTDVPRKDWKSIPLLLCVAEFERPGRIKELDHDLFLEIEKLLQVQFAPESCMVAHGRASMAVALVAADKLLKEHKHDRAVIAGVDSLLHWPTLSAYDKNERMLSESNSNGFMPGEGAGAVLIGTSNNPHQLEAELRCNAVGFGLEKAHIDSGEPLRAEGLTTAIQQALKDANLQMHNLDFRITDLSGEQYYFKEASLALSRTMRSNKESFDIWHAAECIGETGSAGGLIALAVADTACRKGYAPGPKILMHMANDAGQRAAVILEFVGPV